ncbi:MAG: putative Ig domain-containing protein [Clostridiales Family XIII bacterium]|jgi:hypothetical protein|nr:putative Ig domain-containing protein [Clostridiales Family XIII bacterium]
MSSYKVSEGRRFVAVLLAVLTALAFVPALGGANGDYDAYADDPPPAEILYGGETLVTGALNVGDKVYQLATTATGIITINSDPHSRTITIIGNGVENEPNRDISIVANGCINLVLQDVFLRSDKINYGDVAENSILDFRSAEIESGNSLVLKGTNLIELQNNDCSKAAIRVAQSSDIPQKPVKLDIGGDGTLYLYKYVLGAGIGGGGYGGATTGWREKSGEITFSGGNIFLKGSKIGAVVGTGGSGPDVTPGPITIKGGNINIEANAHGAAFGGGSAGPGGDVFLEGGNVTITTDYGGPAIGGPAAPYGNFIYKGGSLKTVVTTNAAIDGHYWGGVPGIFDTNITAAKKNADGDPVSRLVFDTNRTELAGAQSYTAAIDGKIVYRGGRHTIDYSKNTDSTIANWVPSQDTNLYLYAPTTAAILSVNGETYDVSYAKPTGFSFTHTGAGDMLTLPPDTSWYSPTASAFTLTSAPQLFGFAQIVNGTADGIARDGFENKTVRLGSDIDLKNAEWSAIGTGTIQNITYTAIAGSAAPGKSEKDITHIADDSLPFGGTFDGQGHTISGLRIDNNKAVQGLFGCTGPDSTIKNFTLQGLVSTTNSGDAVGAVVGFGRGLIERVRNKAQVYAPNAHNVGGIAGYADGKEGVGGNSEIRFSSNESTVTGYLKVGGITGQNSGLISSSYSKGKVDGVNASSKNGVGGITGRNGNNNNAVEEGLILNCFSSAEICRPGGQKWVGGIVGWQNKISHVRNSYWIGNFAVWNSNTNNPIVGGSDISDPDTRNNYTNNDKHSGSWESEIGILTSSAVMKSEAFVASLNGGGRAWVRDTSNVNDGYPILRGLHVPDGAVFEGVIEKQSDPKTSYIEGHPFDLSGFIAVARYSDGSNDIVTDVSATGSAVGRPLTVADDGSTVTVTAIYNGVSLSEQYTLSVEANQLDSLTITKPPTQTVYAVGETFNTSGMTVRANYLNGLSSKTLTSAEYTISPEYVTPGAANVISYTEAGHTRTVTITGITSVTVPQSDSSVYQLGTASDLVWFAAQVNQKGTSEIDAKLTNNIDLSGGTQPASEDPGIAALFAPIGTSSKQFKGSFDGGGKTVKLAVDNKNTDCQGLFGYVGTGGTVSDLTVSGKVTGNNYVGGIAGRSLGTIERVVNKAAVTSDANYAGGIAGYVGGGSITDAENTGAVKGNSYVGGIAGYVSSGVTVSNAANSGEVDGDNYVGGAVGRTQSSVSEVSNTGAVKAANSSTTSYAGGVIGYIDAANVTVSDCYNTGEVTGSVMNLGGIVGGLGISSNNKIIDCYNTGAVTSTASQGTPSVKACVGGIVGFLSSGTGGEISGAINTGLVSATAANTWVGGIAGYVHNSNVGNINEAYYWDGSVSDKIGSTTAYGEAYTLTELVEALGDLYADSPLGAAVEKLKAVTIKAKPLAGGEVGQPYSEVLEADGVAPIEWSVSGGSLPNGLALDSETGAISGTPSKAGKFTFTARASGAYHADAREFSVTISEKPKQPDPPKPATQYDISKATVAVSAAVWTGGQIKPKSVTVTLNGKALKSGVDYTISYGANKDIGKGTVTAIAKSASYYGKKSASFDIKPKPVSFKKLTVGKRLIKAAWAKAAAAQKLSGYQIQYRVKGKAKWSGIKKVAANKLSYTIKKLKKNSRYEVRIRTYKTIKSGASKGTYCGEWRTKTSGRVK